MYRNMYSIYEYGMEGMVILRCMWTLSEAEAQETNCNVAACSDVHVMGKAQDLRQPEPLAPPPAPHEESFGRRRRT